jgi:uncharacterized protein YukE
METRLVAFDIERSKTSSRKLQTEYDKLVKQTEKLNKQISDISIWWEGGSKEPFIRDATLLLSNMRKAADRVLGMRDDMNKAAEYMLTLDTNVKSSIASPSIEQSLK